MAKKYKQNTMSPKGAHINNRRCNLWTGNTYSTKHPRRGQLLITMGATRGKKHI